jgi:hypothetical protein
VVWRARPWGRAFHFESSALRSARRDSAEAVRAICWPAGVCWPGAVANLAYADVSICVEVFIRTKFVDDVGVIVTAALTLVPKSVHAAVMWRESMRR